MAVGEGRFVLYSRVEPALEAGAYRFTAGLDLTAGDLGPSTLGVADAPIHVTVRAPRYLLPPDQVLSTFPPAGSEGAYGARLPQVVLRRRTLPWERLVAADQPKATPWLALVVIAEGADEGELVLNQPVAECTTPGVRLAGQEVQLGHYLRVRKSVVDRVFPTRKDVPLLAHAREVDLNDTELMMGDDDGFLAVVIANRLPLPGRDPGGATTPVRYLACLINLEGQFDQLLPEAPIPLSFSTIPNLVLSPQYGPLTGGSSGGGATTAAASMADPYARRSQWSGDEARSVAEIYTDLASGFTGTAGPGSSATRTVAAGAGHPPPNTYDPELRFPVLMYWSFTTTGTTTLRSLMEGLDSGLLGTVAGEANPPGRLPLEVVQTGHVGLPHRTRVGDQVRSWYRGPFVPHPTAGDRLPLAHAADQIRIVVPDGREDISLAAAFEIGRLLALARPSMVAALMRWRQVDYQDARRGAVWAGQETFIGELGLDPFERHARLGVILGRALVRAVTLRPGDFLGAPNPAITPGLPLTLDLPPEQILTDGLGLAEGILHGDPTAVREQLRFTVALRPELEPELGPDVRLGRATVLAHHLDQAVTGLAADALREDHP